MTARVAAAVLAGSAVCLSAAAAREFFDEDRAFERFDVSALRWRLLFGDVFREGRIDDSFGSRRLLAVTLAAGAVGGFCLLGLFGFVAGLVLAPVSVRWAIRARRRRYAAQIDACAAELALALASALAAGRSVRGALLTAGASTPQPLAAELDRAVVDLALGGGIGDALAALRSRTGSTRIESMAGAIELHRGSGGDLVKLMRELADAFRDRDRALRDAHSASAQARFTAIVVAAIPVCVLAALELASPGSVSGALSLVPTALMMAVAIALMAFGVALSQRLGSASE